MAEQQSITPAASQAETRKARSVEHQRLSAAIKSACGQFEDGGDWAYLCSWHAVINLCRETFARAPRRTYQDHLRFLALRDAADAIARAAIGEA